MLAMFGARLDDETARGAAIAFVLFGVSVVLATATISNDNLQDLKTGYLWPRRGGSRCAWCWDAWSAAWQSPRSSTCFYTAYGFPGAMPRAGMDPTRCWRPRRPH
ncbi:MAG: hypothetical protein WDN04_07160 [Rhodospirillales bacterium]